MEFFLKSVVCVWKLTLLGGEYDISIQNGVYNYREHDLNRWIGTLSFQVKESGPISTTKPWDFLQPNLVKSRSREIGKYNDCIA